MTFKDRLRAEIEYKGLPIKEISKAAGISHNTFLSYIDSRGYLPNVETAVKIAKILGVSVEYLVTGDSSITEDTEQKHRLQIFMKLSNRDRCLLLKIANSMLETEAD